MPESSRYKFHIDGIRVEMLSPEQVVKEELDRLSKKRKEIEDSLKAIENQIYGFETNYLQSTWKGNIVSGWINYHNSYYNGGSGAVVKKIKIDESERLFTHSSATAAVVKNQISFHFNGLISTLRMWIAPK